MSCKSDYEEKTIKLNDDSNITLCVKKCDNDYRTSDNEKIETKIFSLDNLITSTKPFKYVCIREKDNSNCRPDEKENKLGQCIKFADQYIPPDYMDIINAAVPKPQIPIIDVVNDIQKRVICATKQNNILENECSILGGEWNNEKCTNQSSLVNLTMDECTSVGGVFEGDECIVAQDKCSNLNYVSDTRKCQKYADICLGIIDDKSGGSGGGGGGNVV